MNDQPPNEDLWQACPQGELQKMVRGVRTRRRRQMLKQFGTATASLFLVGIVGYVSTDRWLGSDGFPPGGIACNEVMRLLPAFHARKLEPTLAQKVSIHLDECPQCGPAYEQMVAAKRTVAHVRCCGGHHDRMTHGRKSIG